MSGRKRWTHLDHMFERGTVVLDDRRQATALPRTFALLNDCSPNDAALVKLSWKISSNRSAVANDGTLAKTSIPDGLDS